MCCTRLAENTGHKKVAKNRHLGTIAQLCRAISSQLRHLSTIAKKLVNQQYVLQMSPRYGELGPLVAEIGPVVWGTTAYFNGFRVLATLLHGSPVVGVSQTLWRWTDGTTYVWQGDHHIGHWPTFKFILFVCQKHLMALIGVKQPAWRLQHLFSLESVGSRKHDVWWVMFPWLASLIWIPFTFCLTLLLSWQGRYLDCKKLLQITRKFFGWVA